MEAVLCRPTTLSFVQDVVHIAVKLKSRLIKPSIILPLGKFTAGVHHLRMLRVKFGKDAHGLREKDINHRIMRLFYDFQVSLCWHHLVRSLMPKGLLHT